MDEISSYILPCLSDLTCLGQITWCTLD